MKFLFLFFIILATHSCHYKGTSTKVKDLFFYTSSIKKGFCADTVTQDKIFHHNSADLLVSSKFFEYNDQRHLIRMYITPPNSCSNTIEYELDNLGIIYARGTAWIGYQRLRSNNDSINRIIEASLEFILANPKLLTIPKSKDKTISF